MGVYLFCYTFCMPRGAVEFFLAFVVMGIVWYDAYIGGMVGVGVLFGLAIMRYMAGRLERCGLLGC